MLRLFFTALILSSAYSFAYAQDPNPPVFEDAIYDTYTHLVESHDIAGFRLELWRPGTDDAAFGQAFRLFNPDGSVAAKAEDWLLNFAYLGDDLNANGTPNLMIEGFSGGAHCCNTTWLFELSQTAQLVFKQDYSECGVALKDLDGDGIAELVSCDDT